MKYCSYILVRISFIFYLLVLIGSYCWIGVSVIVIIVIGSIGVVLFVISWGWVVVNFGFWLLVFIVCDIVGFLLILGVLRIVNYRIEVNF